MYIQKFSSPQLNTTSVKELRCFELMTADYAIMTPQKRADMRRWRRRQMLYTVCYESTTPTGTRPRCSGSAGRCSGSGASPRSSAPASMAAPADAASRSQVATTPAPRLVSVSLQHAGRLIDWVDWQHAG
jgi:hypothetical protein